ncbi:MAG: hypothetical protein AAGK67_18000, partial [Pseudomonadota bacterium]
KHRSDGPKADNALTIKPDHPMGARQFYGSVKQTIRPRIIGLTLHIAWTFPQAREHRITH